MVDIIEIPNKQCYTNPSNMDTNSSNNSNDSTIQSSGSPANNKIRSPIVNPYKRSTTSNQAVTGVNINISVTDNIHNIDDNQRELSKQQQPPFQHQHCQQSTTNITNTTMNTRAPTVDPSLNKPPPPHRGKYNKRTEPIIHHLTQHNRPMRSRRMIPVSNIFERPISNFWNDKWHSFNHMQTELSKALVYSDDKIR